MPAPIHYSHRILHDLAKTRHANTEKGLGPDAKSQITLQYENGKPVRATSVVVSTQHDESLSQEDVREIVRPHVVAALPDGWMCDDAEFYVNPTGRFVIGGPDGDAGLTGRKIIVDTYGGAAPHGGGAFSVSSCMSSICARCSPSILLRRRSVLLLDFIWSINVARSIECPTTRDIGPTKERTSSANGAGLAFFLGRQLSS